MRKKKNSKIQQIARCVGFLIFVVVAAIIVAKVIDRFTPESKKMSGYSYFDMEEGTDQVMVMLNGTQEQETGIYVNDTLYLPQEYITDNINIRFYNDQETSGILYSDSEAVYTFYPDINGYSDTRGMTYQTENPVVITKDGQYYLNFEFVAERTNCSYVYANDPQRVIISTDHDEVSCVTVEKNSQVRYRAGIKSKVLEEVNKGDKLYYIGTIDDWTEVRTESGYTGYIKTSKVSDVYEEVPEDTYVETYQCISKENKVVLGWFQTTSITANSTVDQYVEEATGLNTLSPTWYSIENEQGEFTSIASKELVDNMHARGIEVWPLVDDFDKNVDYKALYSSKTARTKMVETLISDAKTYGYDGINIDFENVKQDYAQDYLQFIRELSIACQDNNIVLSTDNYKPQSYNSFYNLTEQSVFVDYIIIMGYDEHYAGSDAGSVASLPFVESGIADAVAMVPSNQVINAIPFYTRIWTVSSSGTTSKAVGMEAAVDEMNQNGATATWDSVDAQNYCSYEKDGAQIEIWLEDEQSIAEKMKLYSKYQLAGVACWKLGFETTQVWNVITDGLDY